jgi:polysaccharide export outer membrane protein
MKRLPRLRRLALPALVAASSLSLGACGAFFNTMPSAGALRGQVEGAKDDNTPPGVVVVDVNHAVTKKLVHAKTPKPFAQVLAGEAASPYKLSPGDVVEVTVWEAPPATLFAGGIALDPRAGAATTRGTTFPEQVIADDGTIGVPFAGRVEAKGLLPTDVEQEIAKRLKGKANQPQVLVRLLRNNTSTVTIVGEVNASQRMSLTPRGERVLDAIAAAGGVRAPIARVMVQLTRGETVNAIPLDTVIRDPKQNVLLRPGDVLTAVFQNQSFTVLGATTRNEEVQFEATGISLAQALARAGGLQDARADAQGVFLFRWEDKAVFEGQPGIATNAEGKVPVIYRADLKDPATFFHAQSFPVQHGDLLYVSNANATELQKFLSIVSSVVFPVLVIQSFIPR